MSSKETKKVGFFQRLFGRTPSEGRRRPTNQDAQTKPKPEVHSSTVSRPSHGTSPSVPTQQDVTTVKSPAKDATARASGTPGRRPAAGKGPAAAAGGSGGAPAKRQGKATPRAPKTTPSGAQKRIRRRRKKKKVPIDAIRVDTSVPLSFPATPEMILAHHKAKPFLDKTEEWMVMSLNEYECMLDGLEIVRTMGRHSQFFEVEPEDLCEEFFEFVEDAPSYDEVINEDIWQEFRYEKYNW